MVDPFLLCGIGILFAMCMACFYRMGAADSHKRAVELEAENAKLRERDGNLFNAIFAKNNELIDVLCENEKLRELVRELWEGYADPPCEDCPLKDKPACVDCPICAREAAVIDRMRELGVEVPT